MREIIKRKYETEKNNVILLHFFNDGFLDNLQRSPIFCAMGPLGKRKLVERKLLES
jgi:hypothetical protein